MDFLIKNGTIYDPAQHKTWKGDIALVDGKIAAPSENHQYRQVIDAEGCIVTSGLIDYHVHYMRGASEGGVQGDVVSFCSGITTVVDGGTAGTGMYEHIYRTIVANSQVRFLNLLLAASGGQSNNQYPENLDPALMDEKKIVEFFKKYPDNLVGLKTRISHGIIEADKVEASVRRPVALRTKHRNLFAQIQQILLVSRHRKAQAVRQNAVEIIEARLLDCILLNVVIRPDHKRNLIFFHPFLRCEVLVLFAEQILIRIIPKICLMIAEHHNHDRLVLFAEGIDKILKHRI